MQRWVTAFILLSVAGAVLFAGCTQPATPAPAPVTPTPVPDTVRVAANPQHGQILTDANERTLYYFARDSPGYGTTYCTGSCAATWPPFNATAIQVSPPLRADDFGVFGRSDGLIQVTYFGWPLYYYSGDRSPGDANGYGFNKLWYVMGTNGVVTLAPTTKPPTPVPTTPPVYNYGGGYSGGGGGGGGGGSGGGGGGY
ncbi:MAG TPA: hypothetical protein VKO45_08230 [Methanomicrobiales archaeon]|nr:hypothetical protein [Methanomicrobiales archaeon]